MKLVVHVDGGARGNPGPAAAAAVLSTPDGDVVDEATELLGRRDQQRRRVPRAAARARARAGAGRRRGRGRQRLRARRQAGQRRVQGQARGHEAAARRGARGAARLRALVGALGAARAERRRRRAGQPGARRRQGAAGGQEKLVCCRLWRACRSPSHDLLRPMNAARSRPDRSYPSGPVVALHRRHRGRPGLRISRVRRGGDRRVARQRPAHRRGARRARRPDALRASA